MRKRNIRCYRIFNFALEVEIWTKNLQKRCFTLSGRLWRSITFSQVEIKKSVTRYFSPCLDEENKKKTVTKSEQKMKTLEAKPFDQNAENWNREIDCLHRPCSRPAPRAKSNRYARTQKSVNSLIRFHCSNSCFLLETGIAGHERLLLAKWHTKSEKNCENGRFSTALTGMKSCTVDRGCTPAPKDATKLAVFFRFFRVFPLTFQ